jgi:hypothetical protein
MIHGDEAGRADRAGLPFENGASRLTRIGVVASFIGALSCHSADQVQLGVGGSAGAPAAQAGTSGSEADAAAPLAAPECGAELPSFVTMMVLGSLPDADRATPGVHELEGHIVERGHGLPAALSELPGSVASADALGWVRLEPVAAPDAGAPVAAPDAGAPVDAGTSGGWTIVGPRDVGDMAVPLGATVQVTVEDVRRTLAPGRFTVVARLGERVVLFHQESSRDAFGTFEGFRLTRGAIVCSGEERAGCIYTHQHELEVTVPGGASASLAPGESRVLGDYHVLHGETMSLLWRIEEPNQGGGECNDIFERPNQVTAVYVPSP